MHHLADIVGAAGIATGVAGIATGTAGYIADASSMQPQEWTAMALLAALTLGGFAFLSKHFDKLTTTIAENSKAQAEVAKSMALLAQENALHREEIRESLRDLRDAVDEIHRRPKNGH